MLKPRLEKFYEKVVCEDFILLYNFKNIAEVPTLERAILSSTSNQFSVNSASLLQSFCAWFIGTTQKCVTTRARKSIALFGIRKDNLLGLKITLRKTQLFSFLDKVLIFVLPHLISKSKIAESNLTMLDNKKRQKKTQSLRFSNNKARKVLRDSFTISNRSALHFPEVSQLSTFFDFLPGFSFSCSIKQSKALFCPLDKNFSSSFCKSAIFTPQNTNKSKETDEMKTFDNLNDQKIFWGFFPVQLKKKMTAEQLTETLYKLSKTKTSFLNRTEILKLKGFDKKHNLNFAKKEQVSIEKESFFLSTQIKKVLLSAFQYPINI